MKKIARISKDCFFENDTFTDTIIVRKSDLDALEAELEKLEKQRDGFAEVLDAISNFRYETDSQDAKLLAGWAEQGLAKWKPLPDPPQEGEV